MSAFDWAAAWWLAGFPALGLGLWGLIEMWWTS